MTEPDEMSSEGSDETDSEERDTLEIQEPRDLFLIGILSPLLLLAFLFIILLISPILETVGEYIPRGLAQDTAHVLEILISERGFNLIVYVTYPISILSIIADAILISDAKLRRIGGVAILPLILAVAVLIGGAENAGAVAGIYNAVLGGIVAMAGWGTIIWYVAARKSALNREKEEPQQPGS